MNETIDFLALLPDESVLRRTKGACWGMPGHSGRKLAGEITVTDRRIIFEGQGSVAAWRPAFSLPYGEISDAETCTVGFLSPTGLRLFVRQGGYYEISLKNRGELLSLLDSRIPAQRPRRKPLPKELIRILICAAIAGLLLFWSAGDTLASLRPARDFENLLNGEAAMGDRIHGTVLYALDYFATEQTWTEYDNGGRSPKKTSAYYYIIPAGDGYAAIKISAANANSMARLSNETYDYLRGGEAPTASVPFDGRIKSLEKEEPDLVSYYRDALEEFGYSGSEIDAMGQPMLLIPRAYGTIRAFCAVGAALALLDVFFITRAFRPARTKKQKGASGEKE